MRRAGVAALAVILLAGFVAFVVPWSGKERDALVNVPSPRALDEVTPIALEPGATACSADLGLDERATQARMQTVPGPGRRPALEATVAGDGYRARATVPETAASDAAVVFPLPSPGRDRLVELCIRNAGEEPVSLAASADRTRSRSITAVDGRPTEASAWIAFAERRPRAVRDRFSDALSRLATFRPGFVFPALLGFLAFLVVVGVPLAVAVAWYRSLD